MPTIKLEKHIPTIDEDFKDDRVIVILEHEYSSVNAKIEKSCFETATLVSEKPSVQKASKSSSKILNISAVEDLSYVDGYVENNNLINRERFRQILALYLEEKGKQNVLDAIAELEKREDVLCAEPYYNDKIVYFSTPNDPKYTNGSQWYLQKINMPNAWSLSTGNSSMRVGILEDGIAAHPDLDANVELVWDTSTQSAIPKNGDGHGTKVAGVLGAVSNNGIGITGVVPSVKMQIIDGDYFYDRLTYAEGHDIRIINASFGFTTKDENGNDVYAPVRNRHVQALANYDGLVIAAAGNESNNNDTNPMYPASYWGNYDVDGKTLTVDNVISVSASDESDNLASFSNYGPTSVHIAAPGKNIYTTFPGNDYDSTGGTSLAAPQVAGVAALIWANCPDLSIAQVRNSILNSVDQIPALANKCSTGGRLNAYRALQYAESYYERDKLLSGDFDGDGQLEYAAFFGLNNSMKLYMWEQNEHPFDTFHGRRVNSSNSFSVNRIKGRVVTGDFDGDGKCDIGAFYDYGIGSNGQYNMGLWKFKGTASGNFATERVCFSEWYNASNITERVVAGDFDGDGKCDIGAFFDYGIGANGLYDMKLWRFKGVASGSFPVDVVCTTNDFNPSRFTNKVAAGDFDGDGKCDIGLFYDYGIGSNGQYNMGLWKFKGTASGNFAYERVYFSDWYNANNITGRVAAGDFDGDGKCDLGAFYDYGIGTNGNYNMKLWYFKGVASGTFSADIACTSDAFDATKITNNVVSGDFNGDNKCDIDALYKYGNGMGLFRFYGSTNTPFSHTRLW